ncbi:alkaline phosphatase family protein [Actinacidiphila oryziradicis]|uniref:Nucleotide pyrophosphatase n=1 Tax=Actinacidiphila oryziradicis TaxID=2571141 RepID=A0A4U0RU29_9ACTN|nr:alkaline phosphatase family protein [Actinacidiphila oryziradicis]TJZ99619.1 nucleotide pyrophosphatase [Actinacidiphila oryziradicis]
MTGNGNGIGSPRLIFMIDGLGSDYLDSGTTPFLSKLFTESGGEVVEGLWPTVTNVNNAAIACAAPPAVTGITGNSFLDPDTGVDRHMDAAHMLNAPTLLQTWAEAGRRVCLLSAKSKTLRLLGNGLDYLVTSEHAPSEVVDAVGAPPNIYSSEVNIWLLRCLAWLIAHRPDLDTFYVHTTDYPMHMWAPGEAGSNDHLRQLDAAIQAVVKTVPDAEVLLTADHGMNAKTRALDLGRILTARGVTEVSALSIEKDGYVGHHRDLGGSAWVWVDEAQRDRAAEILGSLDGVEQVLPRAEAAAKFLLDPTRMGDLAILADRRTVFGDLATETEELPPGYRSHGSAYEREVPLFRWNVRDTKALPGSPMNWHLLLPFNDDHAR